MSLIRCSCLLTFATTFATGQAPQPVTVVRAFYAQVIAHHPLTIPAGNDRKVFAPFLSKVLLQKFDTASSCLAEWSQRSPDGARDLKYDLLAGNEYGYFWPGPRSFHIQKAESGNDGEVRVYVKLMAGRPRGIYSYIWRVAAVMRHENGHFAIDDIVYINDSTWDDATQKPADRRLSEYLASGCNGAHWIGTSLPTQPEALAQSLYAQVVAYKPGGIPDGEDWKIFAPYMSKSLIHRIDLFNSCVLDWDRQHHDPKNPEKAPFGIFESGIFSGGDERTGPREFHIDRSELQRDGSARVYVTLKWWESEKPIDKYHVSAEKPYTWRVALVLVREENRLTVDDVIYLADKSDPADGEYRLSGSLSYDCDGPRFAWHHEN